MSGPDGFAALSVGEFLDALAAGAPAPAAGSAAALAVAQAAALCAKTARLSARQLTAARADEITAEAERIRAAVAALIDEDPRAYRAVIMARRAAARTGPDHAAGAGAAANLAEALSRAADVPMRIAEHSAEAAEIAAALAKSGNPALRGDALTAAMLAEAGARSATALIEINLAGKPADPRPAIARGLLTRITSIVRTIG